jgi:hypothetical protein
LIETNELSCGKIKMPREQFQYDKISIGINRDIRKGNAPTLKNNNDVRKFAQEQYKKHGLSESAIKTRMDRKDAGHIISRNHGGKNENNNYMWEDRHANRAHQNDTITKTALKRGGRKTKYDV